MLPPNAAVFLAQAIAKIIKRAEPGRMAFVRCLRPDVVRALAADDTFAIPGWRIAAVVPETLGARRFITADQAVERREAKREADLLLVDPAAGAGMDGIYNAALEIGEGELFKKALDIAAAELAWGYKGFAKKALRKAGWGRRRHPWPPGPPSLISAAPPPTRPRRAWPSPSSVSGRSPSATSPRTPTSTVPRPWWTASCPPRAGGSPGSNAWPASGSPPQRRPLPSVCSPSCAR